jgi:hypothetical protein
MNRTNKVQAFHPSQDGLVKEEHFLRLLVDAYQVASGGRKRVDLRELQLALFRRGWHP